MVLFLWPTQKKNSPRHPALLVPLCWHPSFWHCEDLHLAFYEHTPQRPSLRSTHSPSRLRSCITQESWTPPLDVKEKQRHIWYRPILPPVKTSGLNPPVTSRSYPYQARPCGQFLSGSGPVLLKLPAARAHLPHSSCIFTCPGEQLFHLQQRVCVHGRFGGGMSCVACRPLPPSLRV